METNGNGINGNGTNGNGINGNGINGNGTNGNGINGNGTNGNGINGNGINGNGINGNGINGNGINGNGINGNGINGNGINGNGINGNGINGNGINGNGINGNGINGNGIILFNKQKNESSFNCVSRTKKMLKVKKVGHAGTLDPFATGLLLLLVGKSTRLQNEFMLMDKKYHAIFSFGVETDTLDPTGKTTKEAPCPHLEKKEIKILIKKHFLGEVEQQPPAFSAVKIGGKRAYALSRQGVAVNLPMKKVAIRQFDVLSIDNEKKEIEVEMWTSSGTYVRSIARDLACKMNTVAHVSKLCRTKIGNLSIKDAVSLVDRDVEKTDENKNMLTNALQPAEKYLQGSILTMDKIKQLKLLEAIKENNFNYFLPFFTGEKRLKIISPEKKLIALLTKEDEQKSSCIYFDL